MVNDNIGGKEMSEGGEFLNNVKTISLFENKMRKNFNYKYRFIDLFAGIGGTRMAFEKTGGKCVFSSEWDKSCQKTYEFNFGEIPHGDITKIDENLIPDFDILTAGFPCQAFSIAGYRKGFKDDEGRGNLFFDIARIIKAKNPTGFLLENVKNLKSHDNGNTFRIISNTLEDLGYEIRAEVLNSMEYSNIPQNRERIYIVGFKKELNVMDNFEWPEKMKLSRKSSDLLIEAEDIDDKYYYNDKPLFEKINDYPFKEGEVYQWRRKYIRVNKKCVFPTLTANMGMGGHNVPLVKDARGVRKLTPRECFRAQGFPESYKLPSIADSSLYKQAGNSVTVPVVQNIAKQMNSAIIESNVSRKTTPKKYRHLQEAT